MDNPFAIALNDLLAGQCTPAVVRQIESQPQDRTLWAALVDTGFADALLPEEAGGAALPLEQAFDLFEACGRHALPLPLPETMWARALLHRAGVAAPAGPIGLGQTTAAPLGQVDTGLWVDVSAGRCCDHVLAQTPRACGCWRWPKPRFTPMVWPWTRACAGTPNRPKPWPWGSKPTSKPSRPCWPPPR